MIAGPLFADGASWYQIQSADDRYPSFGTASVAGQFLERSAISTTLPTAASSPA